MVNADGVTISLVVLKVLLHVDEHCNLNTYSTTFVVVEDGKDVPKSESSSVYGSSQHCGTFTPSTGLLLPISPMKNLAYTRTIAIEPVLEHCACIISLEPAATGSRLSIITQSFDPNWFKKYTLVDNPGYKIISIAERDFLIDSGATFHMCDPNKLTAHERKTIRNLPEVKTLFILRCALWVWALLYRVLSALL